MRALAQANKGNYQWGEGEKAMVGTSARGQVRKHCARVMQAKRGVDDEALQKAAAAARHAKEEERCRLLAMR